MLAEQPSLGCFCFFSVGTLVEQPLPYRSQHLTYDEAAGADVDTVAGRERDKGRVRDTDLDTDLDRVDKGEDWAVVAAD